MTFFRRLVRTTNRHRLWVGLLVCACAPLTSADEIILHNGSRIGGIKVFDLKGSDIRYRYRGQAGLKAVRDIKIIHLDALPELKNAERLYANQRYEQAVHVFLQTQSDATADWQKKWIGLRLIPALDHAGDFTEAVQRYLVAVKEFPYEAERLRPKKVPALPADRASKLVAGIKAVRGGLASRIARDALEALMLSIQDAAATRAIANDKTLPPTAKGATGKPGRETPPRPADRNASIQGVATLLTKARIALRNREYDQAGTALASALQRADKVNLPEAYFLQGRLLYEGADDEKALLRSGWWFTRVLANFKDSELAGECLYYLARIHKRMGRRDLALVLLRESREASMLPPEVKKKVDATLAEWTDKK